MVTITNNRVRFGFGLIELMVSMSIITIVIGVVLTRHGAFNSAVLLRNQAYEIAFNIREAQQLAVSGGESSSSTGQKQRYGVAFSTANNGDINKNTWLLYKDNNNNGIYNTNIDTELKRVTIDKRFYLAGLKVPSNTNDTRVVFERPFYDAMFYVGNSLQAGPLEIIVSAVADPSKKRIVTVTTAGQITVQ